MQRVNNKIIIKEIESKFENPKIDTAVSFISEVLASKTETKTKLLSTTWNIILCSFKCIY